MIATLAALLFSALPVCGQAYPYRPIINPWGTAAAQPSVCAPGQTYFANDTKAFYVCDSSGVWNQIGASSGGSVPSGMIGMIVTGSCPSAWTQVTALNGVMLQGTLAANGDVGTTGGSNSITATGTVSQPTFSGASDTTSAVSAGTPAGTVAAPTFTGTPFTSVINHTHTITSTLSVQGGTTAATTGTHVMTSTATGGSVRAVAAGDAIASSSANPSGGVSSITPAGTNSAPAFAGSALATHTHTLTPTGTVSQPSLTMNAFDPHPAFTRVIFCSKN